MKEMYLYDLALQFWFRFGLWSLGAYHILHLGYKLCDETFES